jgi:hypothetical protein
LSQLRCQYLNLFRFPCDIFSIYPIFRNEIKPNSPLLIAIFCSFQKNKYLRLHPTKPQKKPAAIWQRLQNGLVKALMNKPFGVNARAAVPSPIKLKLIWLLLLDQSGSMGSSVVYSGIFGSVMASIPAIKTKMVVFDTAVADLTEELTDPVELLFGVQLGGGTDINAALTYCQQIVTKPADTVLVLITDLYEGGNANEMRRRAVELVSAGVQLVVLLALNDDGAPSYDHRNAQFLADLGVPVFACTPDKFPDLMAAALTKQDIALWAAREELIIKK